MAGLKLQAISEQFRSFRTRIPHISLLPRKKTRAWRVNQPSPISKHKNIWYFNSTPHPSWCSALVIQTNWISFSSHINTDFLSINAAIVSDSCDKYHLYLPTRQSKKMTSSSLYVELNTSKKCSSYFRMEITLKHIRKIYEWCSVFSGSKKLIFLFSTVNILRFQDDGNDLQQVSWCVILTISCLKGLQEKIWCDFKTTIMFIYLELPLRYKLYQWYRFFPPVIKRLWARSNYRKSFHSLMLK